MSKLLLLATILLVSMVSSEMIPLNYSFQSLRKTIHQTVRPDPIVLPPTPTMLTNDNPCGFRNYCGQAVPFKSQAQLKAFTDKNCQPLFKFFPLQLRTQAQASPDFSGTNNQQANVDEADILKTDGEYIYTVSGNILSIVKAYPYTSVQVKSTLTFTASPQSLFIEGNYLTVFGTDYENTQNFYGGGVGGGFSKRPYYFYRPPYTWVYVYDICDKSNPKLVKDYKFEGAYLDGRKTANGFVYLLSSLNCNGRQTTAPWYNFGQGKKPLQPQKIFYYPGNEYDDANFINILAFNLKNPLSCEQNIISVLSLNTYVIYMSETNIYLTGTRYLADTQITSIHKIFVSRSRIIPMADGQVEGTVNNQFSMDEYNGTLRIATTERGITGQPSNSVFCLNRTLKVIGTLRNIAVGETIFSARYVDKRLYLVTFRQIDPFFVIDLSNHSAPAILGELKITGFSRYLHPYDENTIIGFGRQTNEQGQQQGLKVTLFDVQDVTNPQSVADFVLTQQYAFSTAEWESKAFLFSKQKNLLVIPGSYYSRQNPANTANNFNGALVFYIKRDTNTATIQLRGIVNHVVNATDEFYDRSVERSLYIEELLYTKSRCLLRINTLSHLNPVVNLPLNCNYDPIVEPRPVSDPVVPSPSILVSPPLVPFV